VSRVYCNEKQIPNQHELNFDKKQLCLNKNPTTREYTALCSLYIGLQAI